jgi:hypothetical protein
VRAVERAEPYIEVLLTGIAGSVLAGHEVVASDTRGVKCPAQVIFRAIGQIPSLGN